MFEHMSPDQQQKFKDNFQRWQNMPQVEREALRQREDFRREKILEEVNQAIKDSGLQLDAKTRDLYVIRYVEERRRIEEDLQREMEAKRKPMLQQLANRLKSDFKALSLPSASPSAVASPAASTSPSPTASASPAAK